MESIEYIGEHLLPGRLGQLSIILAFVSAIVATVAYYFATQRREIAEESQVWRRMGRMAFLIQGLGIFATIGLIFYMMINQFYEYQYVQAHVSEDLPMQYIFSAFWEGQEGSFLLWLFWHVVLGVILMFRAKNWESSVMTVLSSVQIVLISMILGVYLGFGDDPAKIGSNPFLLLRDVEVNDIFNMTNYVEMIEGSGLNPLLQNYWMTIHPPTLFLGFASTVVPFCFAIAGLWVGKHQEALQQAFPWAGFSGFILGLGILMGGAWAYEALNFGGYWAWDPVENASLVPWLFLIAGVHTNLIARATGHAIKATYAYYALCFVFIVYSTYLTRSGILGETSVHAFTEMGLEVQLIGFILLYTFLSIFLLAKRWKSIPVPVKEEATSSKEFWVFIGSLILLFSGILIISSTSLPVFNKIIRLFQPDFGGSVITDPVPHYNKYQLWIGVFIGLLSGASQYLRWRGTNLKKQGRKILTHIGVALVLAGILSFLTMQWINIPAWQYFLLLFAGLFAVVTNLDYALVFSRQNWKAAGSAISHVGFGLLLVGVLASGLNQRVISKNSFLMEGLTDDEEMKRNNIILIENSPMLMEDFELTFTADTLIGHTRSYNIDFKRMNPEGEITETFSLEPNILYNNSFTKMAASNPSTRHYWDHDIFTTISSLPPEEIDIEARKAREDSLRYQSVRLEPLESIGLVDTTYLSRLDTFRIDSFRVTLEAFYKEARHPEYEPEPGDFGVGAKVRVQYIEEDTSYVGYSALVVRNNDLYTYPAQINPLNVRIKLDASIFEELFTSEEDLPYQEYLVAEGDTWQVDDLRIQFAGYDRSPEHPEYIPEEGDIAVAAMLSIQDATGQSYMANPIFLVRDSKPLNVKDIIEPLGLHCRFVSLDPKTGRAALYLAKVAPKEPNKIPMDIAFNSYRTDWVVFQAILFPGINLVWGGSLMMLGGLLMSMFYRRKMRTS